jgi:hypothetical protein
VSAGLARAADASVMHPEIAPVPNS